MVEDHETFNVMLSLPPSLDLHITVDDDNSAEVIIIDSTGMTNL